MDLAQDTDALFRQHSIPELRALHSQLQKEAFAKKGHLRVMVGERYRDVIQASDSIRHMRDASESLKGLLDKFGPLLQIRASYEAAEKTRKSTLTSKDSVAEQTKQQTFKLASLVQILVQSPETIWHSLERHEYLKAAGMYLVADAVYKEFLVMQKDVGSEIKVSFPVAHRQWEMIQNMKGNILDGASDRLIKCKGAQLAETLCAIRVLTDKSWEDLLALFLQKRLALLKENASATDSSVDVRLCQDIMDSHSTLQILYETFTSASQQHSQSSLLKHTLSTFLSQLACDDPKKSILNDWYAINANVSLLVPHILPALSRICVQEGEQDLKTETLQINANEWIQKSASEGMRRESETLLLNVKLGKELSEIRDQVIRCVARLECGIILEAANTPPSTAHIPPWSQITRTCFGHDFSFWNDVLFGAFKTRFLSLINSSFSEAFASYFSALESELGEMSRPEHPDYNLRQYYWKHSGNGNTTRRSAAWYQDSRTPASRKLGDAFTQTLKEAREKLEPILSVAGLVQDSMEHSKNLVMIFSLDEISRNLNQGMDQSLVVELEDFAGQCSRLLGDLKATLRNPETEVGMAKIIFIGRLCRQLVASYGATPQSHSKDSRKHDISKIRPILIKIYDESHEIWMTETLKTFAEGLGSWLDRENWALKERYTGVWGVHEIDGVEENKKETVLLPTNASTGLMKLLFSLASSAHDIAASDMEKHTLDMLSIHFGTAVLTVYQNFAKSHTDKIAENSNIQLLFDVLFIHKLLETAYNVSDGTMIAEKLELKKSANAVLSVFRSRIDPIDLAVFDTYLVTNSERFLQRHSALLTPLVSFRNRIQDSRLALGTTESHQVLPLAPSVPRFSVLPVGMALFPSARRASSLTETGLPSTRRKKSDLRLLTKPVVRFSLVPKTGPTPKAGGLQGTESVLSFVGMASGSGQARERATELFINASSFLSGVLGAPASTPQGRK